MRHTSDHSGQNADRLLFVCSAKGSYTRNDVIRRMLPSLAASHQEVVSEKESYVERLMDVGMGWIGAGNRSDRVLLGFLAQPLVPMALLMGCRRPAMDAFISLYDTLCLDRRVFCPGGLVGRFLKAYDRWCMEQASVVLTDTEENAEFYSETFGVARSKFFPLPVSANPELFKPSPRQTAEGEPVRVLYYCTFLPLHGARVVYEAARLLGTERQVRFTIVGSGPLSRDLDHELERWKLDNVQRIPWVEYEQLGRLVSESDICLAGHFSDNPKAARVVPGKAFQYLASAKPVVLGDSPANRRLFTHQHNAVLCDTMSADDLARTIWHLASDRELRDQVARNGYLAFQARFHPEVLVEELRQALSK